MTNKPFSYEKLLWAFEHDDNFLVDETLFYFDDDPYREDHYIGCLRNYEKPYWAGYCDIQDGCEYTSAAELFNAPIYSGHSIKERWENIVLVNIGGFSADDWYKIYKDEI